MFGTLKTSYICVDPIIRFVRLKNTSVFMPENIMLLRWKMGQTNMLKKSCLYVCFKKYRLVEQDIIHFLNFFNFLKHHQNLFNVLELLKNIKHSSSVTQRKLLLHRHMQENFNFFNRVWCSWKQQQYWNES